MSAEKPCQDLTNSVQYCLPSIHVHEKAVKMSFFFFFILDMSAQDLTNSMQYCLLSIHVHEKLSKELFFSEELPTPPPKTESVCENPGVIG